MTSSANWLCLCNQNDPETTTASGRGVTLVPTTCQPWVYQACMGVSSMHRRLPRPAPSPRVLNFHLRSVMCVSLARDGGTSHGMECSLPYLGVPGVPGGRWFGERGSAQSLYPFTPSAQSLYPCRGTELDLNWEGIGCSLPACLTGPLGLTSLYCTSAPLCLAVCGNFVGDLWRHHRRFPSRSSSLVQG